MAQIHIDRDALVVSTQGAEKLGLWNLRAQVEEEEMLKLVEDFLREMVEYQKKSGRHLQPEETVAWGSWAVQCKEVDGHLEFWEFQGDWTDVEPGVTRTMAYMAMMLAAREELGAEEVAPPLATQLVVITDDVLQGQLPVEGIRYLEEDTQMSGWWLITEGYDGNEEDLKSAPLYQIFESCPHLIPLVGLPAGYRFRLGEEGCEILFDSEVIEGSQKEQEV
ncbi:immunity protein Imm33 domain-containing protein [Desmospora activa]|uniref:Imm33-like domain-containing protein n=1 Tax=Desmospora activa DSM 45169 TaxID=1121389 RepID=A0A2T4Z8T2_9BACL|nr:hypothetical protein [Desmospora activa]PTM58303.1 hypothetical protein C8J48_0884 [Desmospora activa DSM 45169]